jgi:hypothetical protein
MIMACLNFLVYKEKPQTARRGTIAVEKVLLTNGFVSKQSPVEQGVSYYFEVLITMLFIISKVRSHLFSLIVLLQMKMKIKFGTTK